MTDNDTISKKLTLHKSDFINTSKWESICSDLGVNPNTEHGYPDYINTNSSPVSWAWTVEV